MTIAAYMVPPRSLAPESFLPFSALMGGPVWRTNINSIIDGCVSLVPSCCVNSVHLAYYYGLRHVVTAYTT